MVNRRFALTTVCLVLLIVAVPLAGGGKGKHVKAIALTMSDQALQWGPCPEFAPKGCSITVLHGNPAEKNADIFFKLPGKSEIASHRHTSAERMVLVSGQLDVQYEGQAKVTLKPGMYAYGPANLPHSARCESDEPCVLFIAFEEPVDAVPVEMATAMAAQ